MIITKQNLVESGIASLTINANIMKDADGNHIADVMDEAFKTQAMADDGFELVDGRRKTDAEFFVQNDGWFVRVEYAHTKDGKKVVQKADLMFSILEKDLLAQVKADPKFASGALYTFDVAKFPDAVETQADLQAAPHEQTAAEKRAAKKAAKQAEKQKGAAPVEAAPLEIEEDVVPEETAAPTAPVTAPVEAPVVTPAPTVAAPAPTATETPVSVPATAQAPLTPAANAVVVAATASVPAPAPAAAPAPKPAAAPAAKTKAPAAVPAPAAPVVLAAAGMEPVAPVAEVPPPAPLTLNDIIMHELSGDFATYGRSVGNFNLSSTQSLVTSSFLADLQDGDKQAYAKSSTRLIGQGQYSGFGAMLIPASKASSVAASLQQLRQKSYHTYHYECFTDNGWQYRTKGYGMGITVARETTTAKKVSGGILFRPGSAEVVANHPEAADKDYCTADDFTSATPFYAVWNISNESVTIDGVEYKVLMGVISGDDSRAFERDKVMGFMDEAIEHS